VAELIRDAGGQCVFLETDVSDYTSVSLSALGGADVSEAGGEADKWVRLQAGKANEGGRGLCLLRVCVGWVMHAQKGEPDKDGLG
jgi:hypothetical protein